MKEIISILIILAPSTTILMFCVYSPGPHPLWLWIIGSIWLFFGISISKFFASKWIPIPTTINGLRALFNLLLGILVYFTGNPIVLLILLAQIPIFYILRLIRIRIKPQKIFTVDNFIVESTNSKFHKSLLLYRAVAIREGKLTLPILQVIFHLHYFMAINFYNLRMYVLENYETEENIKEAQRRESVIRHARLALFYAKLFKLHPSQYASLVEMHLKIAECFLLSYLKSSEHDKHVMLEAALFSLINAIQDFSLRLRLNSKDKVFKRLRQISSHSDFEQDSRLATLLNMLEMGASAERLEQIRAEIHLESEEQLMSQKEIDERQWAVALKK